MNENLASWKAIKKSNVLQVTVFKDVANFLLLTIVSLTFLRDILWKFQNFLAYSGNSTIQANSLRQILISFVSHFHLTISGLIELIFNSNSNYLIKHNNNCTVLKILECKKQLNVVTMYMQQENSKRIKTDETDTISQQTV